MISKETIFRFIERKATIQEQKEVLEWLESSAENRKEYARHKNLSVAVDMLALEHKRKPVAWRRYMAITMRVAAILVVAVSLFFIGGAVQDYRLTKSASGQFTEIVAQNGEVLHFNLPDGSKVVLNGGSTLRFSKLFNERGRDVYLQGEGYFEVEKGNGHFNVIYPTEHPLFKLSVLGTKFNISSYPDKEEIITTLYEGAIEIEDLNTKGNYTLAPNTRHIYAVNTGVSALEPFAETYKWTDKYVVAKDEDIAVFTKRLEAIFNVKIIVDEKLVGHCSYTGALYGGSLQQILDNMTFVSNIKYTIKDSGKTVIIESK